MNDSAQSIEHAAEARTERRRGWAPAVAAAILALALYAVTLRGTYVYDDILIVTDDPRLHDASLWVEYWTSDYAGGALDRLYRPLVSMSYAIQWQLHGDRPWAFHAVNWVLHALVSALVAELGRRLAGLRAAYAAGLLFAAHPVHVEAVANIVGRAELMCAAGILGSLVLAARPPLTPRRAVGIIACFVVALLSKEQGMLLPLLLLLVAGVNRLREPWADGPAKPMPPPPARRQVLLLLTFAICATLAGYIVFRESTIGFTWDRSRLDWVMNPMVRSRGGDRWLVPLALLGRYTLLLVAPLRLSMDYGADVIGWVARRNDPYLWLGAASLVTWLALLIGSVTRRAWTVTFFLLATALTYGLVSNFLSLIGTIFGERLMYLPSAFFVILLAIACARLPRRSAAVGLAVVVAIWSVRTVTYAQRWNDRLAFYETSLREQPDSAQLYLLLSAEYRALGMLDRADQVLAESRRKWPDYWLIHNYSALLAIDRGDYDAAEYHVRRSVSLESNMQAVGISEMIMTARAATQPAATRPSRDE